MSSSVDKHQTQLRQIIENNRQVLQDQLHLYADPAKALQVVFDLMIIEQKLAHSPIEVLPTPQMVLDALESTEKWYSDQNLEYPQPEWLQKQRMFWKEHLSAT